MSGYGNCKDWHLHAAARPTVLIASSSNFVLRNRLAKKRWACLRALTRTEPCTPRLHAMPGSFLALLRKSTRARTKSTAVIGPGSTLRRPPCCSDRRKVRRNLPKMYAFHVCASCEMLAVISTGFLPRWVRQHSFSAIGHRPQIGMERPARLAVVGSAIFSQAVAMHVCFLGIGKPIRRRLNASCTFRELSFLPAI